MGYVIAGLGNPGDEYEGTRHNVGRMVVEKFAKKHELSDWKADKYTKALVAKGKVGKESVVAVLPETFMNNSGKAVAPLVKSAKQAEKLVVVYDDLDLPLGTLKISFDRGSGGHRGLESIIKALKTRAFVRVRVGVSPTTPSGKLRKPAGEDAVIKFILGKFSAKETEVLKKVIKRASDAVELVVTEGREHAMGDIN